MLEKKIYGALSPCPRVCTSSMAPRSPTKASICFGGRWCCVPKASARDPSAYHQYVMFLLLFNILQVTHTPWEERVLFVFNPKSDLAAKPLHVSPFMMSSDARAANQLFCYTPPNYKEEAMVRYHKLLCCPIAGVDNDEDMKVKAFQECMGNTNGEARWFKQIDDVFFVHSVGGV